MFSFLNWMFGSGQPQSLQQPNEAKSPAGRQPAAASDAKTSAVAKLTPIVRVPIPPGLHKDLQTALHEFGNINELKPLIESFCQDYLALSAPKLDEKLQPKSVGTTQSTVVATAALAAQANDTKSKDKKEEKDKKSETPKIKTPEDVIAEFRRKLLIVYNSPLHPRIIRATHEILKGLTKFKPLDTVDPVTYCDVEDHRCIFSVAGNRFDMDTIVRAHLKRGNYALVNWRAEGEVKHIQKEGNQSIRNPFAQEYFSPLEVLDIIAVVSANLKSNPTSYMLSTVPSIDAFTKDAQPGVIYFSSTSEALEYGLILNGKFQTGKILWENLPVNFPRVFDHRALRNLTDDMEANLLDEVANAGHIPWQKVPRLRTVFDSSGNFTLLHAAVAYGRADVMKTLIEDYKIDPKTATDTEITPSYLAFKCNQPETAQVLAEYKINPKNDVRSSRGKGFLIIAAINGDTDMLSRLNEEKAVYFKDGSPFPYDFVTFNPEIDMACVRMGDQKNEFNKFRQDVVSRTISPEGWTAAHFAALHDQPQFIHALHQCNQAIVYCTNEKGKGYFSPLDLAIRLNRKKVICAYGELTGFFQAMIANERWDAVARVLMELKPGEPKDPDARALLQAHSKELITVFERLLSARELPPFLKTHIENTLTKKNGLGAILNGPLHSLVEEGNAEKIKNFIKRLKQHGLDYNPQDEQGRTPLYRDIKKGNLVVFMQCPEITVDKHAKNGDALIHTAARLGDFEMIDQLVKKFKVDVNAPNANGETALHIACAKGNLVLAMALTGTLRANPHALNKQNETPVYLAVKHGASEISKHFAGDYKLTPETQTTKINSKDYSFAEVAVINNDEKMIRTLFQLGYDLSNQGIGYMPPLYTAIESNQLKMVQVLCDCKVNVNLKCGNLYPILMAASLNRAEMINELKKSGAALDVRSGFPGYTPLMRGAASDFPEIIYALSNAGANMEEKISEKASITGHNYPNAGATALLLAVNGGHNRATTALLECKANPNAQLLDGTAALHMIAQDDKKADLIPLFVRYNANLFIEDQKQQSPLYLAAKAGNNNVMAEFKKQGVTINTLHHGLAPVHIAVINDDEKALAEFKKHGVDYGLKGLMGNTPMHFAAIHNRKNLMKHLLQDIKVDLVPLNDLGQTPYEVACESKSNDTARYLFDEYIKYVNYVGTKNFRRDAAILMNLDAKFIDKLSESTQKYFIANQVELQKAFLKIVEDIVIDAKNPELANHRRKVLVERVLNKQNCLNVFLRKNPSPSFFSSSEHETVLNAIRAKHASLLQPAKTNNARPP